MGAIPSGKGGERFPQLPPPKAGFGGIWGVGRPAATTCCCSGRGGVREKKEGGGEEAGAGPGHWPCRASPHGATGLSRQCMWRDREGHVAASVATLSGRRASVAPVVLARQSYSVAPLFAEAQ